MKNQSKLKNVAVQVHRSPDARLRLAAATVLVLAAGSAFGQTTRTWRNPVDGTFTDPANWVASAVPLPTENAQFGLSSSTTPYTVSFLGNAQLNRLILSNQRPTLNLGGNSLNVTDRTLIGGFNTPGLTVLNGSLNLGNSGESLIIGQNAGQSGSLTIGSGAVVTGLREIGRAGSGTLSILDGGQAFNLGGQWLVAGTLPGGSGDVLVSGAGSMLDLSEGFNLGWNGGQGSLTVAGGGWAYVGYVLNLGSNSTTHNEVVIDGEDSRLSAEWLVKDSPGTADISILNGGRLEVAQEVNVYGSATSTTVLVDGPGSVFDPGFLLHTRDSGLFLLTVSNGGAVESDADLILSFSGIAGSMASLIVTGPGSSITTKGFYSDLGSTALEITDGGFVRCFDEFRMGLGFESGSNSLLIRGAGSELVACGWPNNGGQFFLGYEHDSTTALVDQGGRLTILNNSYIGHRGTGSLTIDGVGSSLETPYRVHVGWGDWRASHGTLTVTNGAVASIGSLSLDARPDGSAEVVIDGPGTLVQAIGPHSTELHNRGAIMLTNGSGLEISPWMALYGSIEGDIDDARIEISSGAYLFSTGTISVGRNEGHRASMILDDGLVFANGTMWVHSGGVVRGTGTIDAQSLNSTGTIEPGLPIGSLLVNNIHFNPGVQPNANFQTTLAIEIGGLGTAHDAIFANGWATLGGTLALSIVNGFAPSAGQTFDILTTAANQRFGTFEAITGSDVGPGLAFVPQYLHDRVRLVVDGVTGFDIAQSSVAVAEGFAAAPISATATYAVSAPTDVTSSATWTSDNPAIATVDATGLIRGVDAGTTTIRGVYAGIEDTLSVSVRSTPGVIDGTPGLMTTRFHREFPLLDNFSPVASHTLTDLSLNNDELFALSGIDYPQGMRITSQLNVTEAGLYTFYAHVDDFVAIFLNSELISSRDCCGLSNLVTIELQPGHHDLQVDFVNRLWAGFLDVRWSGPNIPDRTIDAQDLVGGVAFADFFVATPPVVTDDVPDLSLYTPYLPATAPDINLPRFPNGYLAAQMQRFEGQLALPDDAEYTFTLNVDDDAKVWINGTLLLDPAWSSGAFDNEHTGSMTLDRGIHDIRVDYTEHAGHFGGIVLRVSSAGIADQVIPAAVFSHGGTSEPDCPADFNGDSLLDFFDVQAFLGAFSAQQPGADLNNDGLFNFFDVQTFLSLFSAGCP